MSGEIVLIVTTKNTQEKAFVFNSHETFLFGRVDDCHICLPEDQQVSRHHFLMEVNPPQICIRDLGSRNGTYINKQKYGGRAKYETPEEGAKHDYPQVELYDGDEIRVGQTILRVQVKDAGEDGSSDSNRNSGQGQADRDKPQSLRVSTALSCRNCGKELQIAKSGEQQGQLCGACEQKAGHDPLTLFQDVQATHGTYYKLSNYKMQKKLGAGGMGAVYLLKHKQDGHLAALKVMLSKVALDKVARHDFLREIENTRKLQHPHVVKFLDSGVENHAFYFLIEYCEGGSVDQLMKRYGRPLTLTEVEPIMLGALEGLTYAHEQGIVHRDVKPQNILLSGAETKWHAKIADLGLAKSYISAGVSGMTVTGGGFSGSLLFMPREQMINFKYVKPVSDVWAMGATIYFMLTGSVPRPSKLGQDPINAILSGQIIPIRQCDPKIPTGIATVIDRSLAVDAKDRYQTAGEMLKALTVALK
jgi:eukaryotic-like serine/threonine-protein kinase